MVNTSAIALGVALFASIAAFLYNPIVQRLEIFGVLRQWKGFDNIHGEGLTTIPDLFGVEDLHYHEPTGIVFGLSEENAKCRSRWFPPGEKFNATDLCQGSLFMLLPNEDHATQIPFSNFPGPFITHGFDLVTSPTDDEQLYIIAVNHLPNPLSVTAAEPHPDIPKARSQIELFSYKVGETHAHHLRSITHPLIRTPNDIFAVSETSFYVTNDHQAREGFSRLLEDVGFDNFGAVSDIIHVSISPSVLQDAPDSSAGITATIAMADLQNPNGLGHGRTQGEVVMVRASSGIVSILAPGDKDGKLAVKDRVQLPSTLDNPFYFHDPYAEETGRDASGFVLAGLAHAASILTDGAKMPILVWLVQPPGGGEKEEMAVMQKRPLAEWTKTQIFADDGTIVNTASTALLVAIPPTENQGRKQAWLIISGFLGVGIYKTKVDL